MNCSCFGRRLSKAVKGSCLFLTLANTSHYFDKFLYSIHLFEAWGGGGGGLCKRVVLFSREPSSPYPLLFPFSVQKSSQPPYFSPLTSLALPTFYYNVLLKGRKVEKLGFLCKYTCTWGKYRKRGPPKILCALVQPKG